jgi:hypothetical protein
METHRVLHDFGELSREDVADFRSALHAARSAKEKIRANIYPSLLTALAVGICIGYLTRRN